MITIEIAKIPIGINNRYPHIKEVARDYLTDKSPEFTVSVSDGEISAEREISETSFDNGYYEATVSYRKIAEILPDYDAFLFHGSVIEVDGLAYIITANSGVGKTTHTRLWLSEFDDVTIINGDKPTIRFIDGIPYACGTPWQGKENYGENKIVRLGGIVFLSRGETNKADEISERDAVMRFMTQIYLPKKSAAALSKTMRLADRLMKSVKLISLECNMDPEAAHVCRRAIVK